MRKWTERARLALRMIAERLLRWCIHPRLRSSCLRALGARIGSNVRIDEVMFINLSAGFRNLIVGDDSYIGGGSVIDLTGRIEIGSHTAISPGCVLITHTDPGSMIGSRMTSHYPRDVAAVRIGDHAWIGANTTVLSGVQVGCEVAVGAGSLVTKDVPRRSVAYGVPAHLVESLDEVTITP